MGVPIQEENEAPLSGEIWRRRGRGEGNGEGVSHQTKESEKRRELPRDSGAEPRPKTVLV